MHVLALIPTGHDNFSTSSVVVINGFGDGACCDRFEKSLLLRDTRGGDILAFGAGVVNTALSVQYPFCGQSDDGSSGTQRGTSELSCAIRTDTRSSCRSKGLEQLLSVPEVP